MQVVPHISAVWLHAFGDATPGALLAFATTGIGFAIDGIPLAEESALLDAASTSRSTIAFVASLCRATRR